MRYTELFEGRWWDDGDTITLYHGTSSALIPYIRQHGLQPPQEDLREYALDILRIYVPEAEWDDELIRLVERRAVRAQYGRQGDRGAVLYFKTNRDGVEGYARNYAEDGGEIASDVLISVAEWEGHNDLSKIKTRRFPGGKPIIVTVEVPKAWCIIDNDLNRMKANIAKAREEGRDWALGDLAEVYDEVFEDREVRIARTIPPEMIVSIEPLQEYGRRLAEADNVIQFPGAKKPQGGVVDHGDGITSKPFSVGDMVDDPPVPTIDISAQEGLGDEPGVVKVVWQGYRSMEYPLFQVQRMLRLRPGENFIMDAWGDNRRGEEPRRQQRIDCRGAKLIVHLQHWVRERDGSKTVAWTAGDFEIDIRDLQFAALALKQREIERNLTPEEDERLARQKGYDVAEEIGGKWAIFRDGIRASELTFKSAAFAWKWAATRMK